MYALFFIFLSFFFGYLAAAKSCLYLWPCINTIIFGIAYLTNQPKILCKKKNGRFNPLVFLLNLPWLSFQYFLWYTEKFFSDKNAYNKVKGAHLTIGRRLLPNEYPDTIETVLDLTAEFNEVTLKNKQYINVPLLDAMPLTKSAYLRLVSLAPEIAASRVYIHCAQGHGRTAMVTALLLTLTGYSKSAADAYDLILQCRPKAKMSQSQLACIHKIDTIQ